MIWLLRFGAPLTAVGVAWCFFKASKRPDNLPDLLRETAGKYFEQDGLCFAPIFEVRDGACWLSIFFQNRFSEHVSAKVQVLPPIRSFGVTRVKLPSVIVGIECPGGAFGVVRLPFEVSERYRGASLWFDVAADRKYPNRKGKLLRNHGGKQVGSIGEMSQGRALLLAILGFAFLGDRASRSARVKLKLPGGMRALPADEAQIEILASQRGLPMLRKEGRLRSRR